MGGDGGFAAVGGREDVGREVVQGVVFDGGPGRRADGADAAAPDQIDPILALVAGHGIEKRQCLDREPELTELLAQGLESLDFVA